jgi:hypothetical protein
MTRVTIKCERLTVKKILSISYQIQHNYGFRPTWRITEDEWVIKKKMKKVVQNEPP